MKSQVELLLSPQESALARESERALASVLSGAQDEPLRVTLTVGDENRERIELPASALQPLAQLLGGIAAGDEVAVVPLNREVSTFEAADLLNVSRPYLIKLLDAGAIPFRRVGTHRRVMMRDLLQFKRDDDAKRAAVLDDLVAEAQELDMGY